ncbi:hypothetical protein M3Y97_00416200 [Aphelenchoides bicaudatus]|nr:hypothetical protein M3Y97_00416200 [Aphelenchoides bicaudatus]
MIESLRSSMLQGCHNDKINLHCPRNTHIVIENVFYGRLVPSSELCPVSSPLLLNRDENTSCDVPEAQARVNELCRGKRRCRIAVRPSFFDRDPCPETNKYLQISYKCRPISFEDQNFCEGSRMELSCKPGKRLFIYSAHYGRTAATPATHCSLREPVHKG